MPNPVDSHPVPHPGSRIRAEVIPRGMSVTKAAALIGVGRPALSNLLNGNASLSAEMAARLERAFKYPREDLLKMQAIYDEAQARQKHPPASARAYVPPFLAIKANDVERWASHNIPARSRFAVFLRTLVHSTGRALTSVDFPGNDDAERPGWDGFVHASEATPWVPAGRSGWEFGTNEDPRAKADDDFEKSVKAIDPLVRGETTFVFVSPRRWHRKSAWIAEQAAKKLWKDVRAYDASDLEQWLEQSLPGQAWFANETRISAEHVRTLDKCWSDWANASIPPLSGVFFGPAVDATKGTLLSLLSNPPEGPILIAADSTEEALAFLAQSLGERGGSELSSFRDRVLVFDAPGVLPRLAAGAQSIIPVVHQREVERELAPFAKSMHSIVVYPRNAVISKPHIALEPANYETFNKALEEMVVERDDISRLTKASGRSLTVLRRQLSRVDAVRTPEWAADHPTATSLVPFLFVGAWNSQNEAEQLGLSLLAGVDSYAELERGCQRLAKLNDAPLWSIGGYRGVISKIDLLYAIAGAITVDDLKRYFALARMVLGEDDPALDLPDDQRWAAAIHGKTREFSAAFREGISETLVLLSVHGPHLFKSRLGIDPETEAIRVVRDLLPLPLTTRVLEANDRDLPTYAEAAPDEFLSILERDLHTAEPAVLGLLRPVDPGAFGRGPSRSGLLWALEGLSWNPRTLPRAVSILARLAQVQINDNWVNKPTNSLESIFRAWMPQTAASHEQRVELMKALAEKFPEVAWKICVAQFGTHHQIGHYNHKPRWRPDGHGFGEPFPTWGPVLNFVGEMVEMALTWKDHSLSKLTDLIERLHDLSPADQDRVWALVEEWARSKASDADKAAMREKVRTATLSRRAAVRAKNNANATAVVTAGKAVYAALEPSDLLHKHLWLFRSGWVEESADEIRGIAQIDYEKRNERIQNLRIDALREVFSQRGLDGILELSRRGKASWVVGTLATNAVRCEDELRELLRLALMPILAGEGEVHSHKSLISGALHAISDPKQREAVLENIGKELSDEGMVQLLLLAPFCKSSWSLVDGLSINAQAKYWREVAPDWIGAANPESLEGVERLLKAGRPRAAFSCIRLELSKVDPQVLFRLLSEMAKVGNDQPGQYMLEQYYVVETFKCLDRSPTLTMDQKAGLEFAYIDALAPHGEKADYGIPNLERYVEANPNFFVHAIAWTYKRTDGAPDPVEFQVPSERVVDMAERGYKLIEAIERIPGRNLVDELEAQHLARWIETVRQSCAEQARGDVADMCLGKLLSRSPIGKDGVWPCEPVRDVMEEIQSESMMGGARTEAYNSRGVHWRAEGGNQERELAVKYLNWGLALQISHPFVASKLLMAMADTYDRDASREDTEAGLRRRMH